MSDRTALRFKTFCGTCDGEGYDSECEDVVDGQCVQYFDVPCKRCEGRGWLWEERNAPDPKWRKIWLDVKRYEEGRL